MRRDKRERYLKVNLPKIIFFLNMKIGQLVIRKCFSNLSDHETDPGYWVTREAFQASSLEVLIPEVCGGAQECILLKAAEETLQSIRQIWEILVRERTLT